MKKKYGYINGNNITLTDHPLSVPIFSYDFLEDVEFNIENNNIIEIFGSEVIYNLILSEKTENLEKYDPDYITESRTWWCPWKKIRYVKRGMVRMKETKPYHKILIGYKILIDEN